jgi:hypothetical protein
MRVGRYAGLALVVAMLGACGGGQAAPRAQHPEPAQVRKPATESSASRAPAPAAVTAPASATATGAAATAPGTTAPTGTAAVAPAVQAATPGRSSVTIKGVHGTLNLDDIHQTMESRSSQLDACIQQGRRRIRWVSGAIKFAFKVDADGHATEVRAVESDLGHHELELCLTTVVTETQFPPPAGRTLTRDFNWGLSVDPAYRAPEPMDAARLDKLLEKKAKDVYKECDLPRARNGFQVTAYVSPPGKITSLGAIHAHGKTVEAEALDCVLEQLQSWRLPKVKKRSKVSFLLK